MDWSSDSVDLFEACLGEVEDEVENLSEIYVSSSELTCLCRHPSSTCKTVQISNVTCCTFIDTGIQISLLSSDICRQLSPIDRETANSSSEKVNIRSIGSVGGDNARSSFVGVETRWVSNS